MRRSLLLITFAGLLTSPASALTPSPAPSPTATVVTHTKEQVDHGIAALTLSPEQKMFISAFEHHYDAWLHTNHPDTVTTLENDVRAVLSADQLKTFDAAVLTDPLSDPTSTTK